jgi:xylan 1,4-beta-xylosidase
VLVPSEPVLAGTYPDPSICRVGDDFYLVTSTFEYFPGLPVFHSTDLVTWTQIGHVIERVDQLDLTAVAGSRGLYAPTIRHHDGVFYLVCTLVDGTGPSGNFVMTATDAAGPWTDPHWLPEAKGFDPSLLFHEGRCWYVGTRLRENPDWHDQADVWLRELDLPTLQLVGDEHVLWHGAVEGAVWSEGPHIYAHDGWFYLVASEGGTEEHHAISVARSREITGPYEGNRANPVFTHRTLGIGHPITGVGHPDLVVGPDGQWWAFLLAQRPRDGYHANLGRETFAVAVDWELGWPVFAPGVGQLAAVEGLRQLGETRVASGLDWNQVRTAASGFYDIETGPSTGDAAITLRATGAGLGDLATPAFVGVRQRHHALRFTATLVEGDGGIALRQSENAWISVGLHGGSTVVRRNGETLLEAPAGRRFELRADDQRYEFWVDGERLHGFDGHFLSAQSVRGFVGVWIGVYSDSGARFESVAYTVADTAD